MTWSAFLIAGDIVARLLVVIALCGIGATVLVRDRGGDQ